MECRDAQFYLRLRRPGVDELGPEATAALDQHLAGCPCCAAESRAAAAFDAAVGAAMRAVPIPVGLRNRLVAHTSARRGAALRRRAYRVVALAASVLLTVGIGIGAFATTRPQPDTAALAMKGETFANALPPVDPLLAQAPFNNWQAAQSNRDAVQQWLSDQGLPGQLPQPFDYNLFLSNHWEEVQGRKVPVILFRSRQGTGFAKVYVFRAAQFDLKDVPEGQSSQCRARPYPDQPAGITYVVVFTGTDLAPFLEGHGPIAKL
jgi:hypothetical protein